MPQGLLPGWLSGKSPENNLKKTMLMPVSALSFFSLLFLLEKALENSPKIVSAKTDPVRFKWGFGEGLLKDKFAFFEAYKSPIPKRGKLLARRPFL